MSFLAMWIDFKCLKRHLAIDMKAINLHIFLWAIKIQLLDMYHKEIMQEYYLWNFSSQLLKVKNIIVNKVAIISNNGKYEENDSFNSIQTLKR